MRKELLRKLPAAALCLALGSGAAAACSEKGPDSGSNSLGESYESPNNYVVEVEALNGNPMVRLSGCVRLGSGATESVVTFGTGFEEVTLSSGETDVFVTDRNSVGLQPDRFFDEPNIPASEIADRYHPAVPLVSGEVVTDGGYKVQCGETYDADDITLTPYNSGEQVSPETGQVVHGAGDNDNFLVLAGPGAS